VSWSGIETCGSIWACPICAAKVRAARGEEVRYYIEKHLAAGRYVTLVSLTTSHTWAEDLVEVYDDVQKAWAKMSSGRPWTRLVDTYGILGPIVAVEVTCGRHGWHPHLHVLLFHWSPMGREGSDRDLPLDLRERWTYMVETHTNRTALGRVGCDVTPISGEAGIAAYLNKIHYEMTRGDLKRGRWGSRSAWQIGMDAAETGDANDIRAWKEYVEATKGRRMLRVSPATSLPATANRSPLTSPMRTWPPSNRTGPRSCTSPAICTTASTPADPYCRPRYRSHSRPADYQPSSNSSINISAHT
jgi:hypothetical protein